MSAAWIRKGEEERRKRRSRKMRVRRGWELSVNVILITLDLQRQSAITVDVAREVAADWRGVYPRSKTVLRLHRTTQQHQQ